MSDEKQMWIVTLRFRPQFERKNHDPHNKQTGTCPTSEFCTDRTGHYHTVVVWAKDENWAQAIAERDHPGMRKSRIEKAKVIRQ